MRRTWDKFGISLSSLCLIHCFSIVLLPLVFPFLITYIHNIWIHIIFALIVVGLFPLAFLPGYRLHKSIAVLATAFVAMGFLLAGIVTEDKVSDWISHALSITGSVLIVTAHILNIRLQKKCC